MIYIDLTKEKKCCGYKSLKYFF